MAFASVVFFVFAVYSPHKHPEYLLRDLNHGHCLNLNSHLGSDFFSFHSGDGTLSIFNIRRQKIEQRSDNMESELLSVAVVKVMCTLYCLGTSGESILVHQHRFWVQADDFIVLIFVTKRRGVFMIPDELMLFSVTRKFCEFEKLFVTRDLKVLCDPWRSWIVNRYSWFHNSTLRDFQTQVLRMVRIVCR